MGFQRALVLIQVANDFEIVTCACLLIQEINKENVLLGLSVNEIDWSSRVK